MSLEAERMRRFPSPSREAEYRLLYPPEVARHPSPWPVEIWRPFADRRLHEFLFSVPPEQKFSPHPETDEFYAGSKRLVRLGMRGILPDIVASRTSKAAFDSLVEHEVIQNWPSYEAAFGPATQSQIALRGYVDQDLFWSRLQVIRSGARVGDLLYLMELVGLETWLRALQKPKSVGPALDASVWRVDPPALAIH